jgi:ATP-dependent RNA helicase DHR2
MPPKVHKRFEDDGDSTDLPITLINNQVAVTTSKKNKNKKKNKKKNKANANQEQNHVAQPSPLPDPAQNGQQKKDSTVVSSEKPTLEQFLKEPAPEKSKLTSQENRPNKRKNIKSNGAVQFLDSEDEDDAALLESDDDENALARSSISANGGNKRARFDLKNKLFQTRIALPMYQAGEEVVQRIMANDVTVLLGETGSGKSTQLPQLLYAQGNKEEPQRIAITQPRRVAAINLATRVSEEMGEVLGQKVGYSVRFQNNSHPRFTHIKYLTDGMLLRELMSSANLDQYSTIILDEAHERTLLTDLLMGLLKRIMKRRNAEGSDNRLRLVVMSATLDAERFSKFFDNADILFVEGKMYPVQRYYLNEPVDDIVDSTIQTVCQVNQSEPTGDILAFLPGQDEIEKVVQRLNDLAPELPKEAPLLVALPLYASLASTAQQRAFEPLPGKNRRKVICATNIAETSLTVPGVRYVIDSGLRKIRVWKPDLGMDTLLTTPISQAAASQRMGRAGREAPGKCFRLFTEETYTSDLPKQTEAEIVRCDVASAILMLKRAGVDDVLGFDWVESPGKRAISAALLKLYGLKALDDEGKITALGNQMALLPVAPQLAAVLLSAQAQGGSKLLSTVIDVVACISVEDLLVNPHPEVRDTVNERRRTLFGGGTEWGDLVMLKEMYDMYSSIADVADKKVWCREVCVSYKGMKNVMLVRTQIKNYMRGLLGDNLARAKQGQIAADEGEIDDDYDDDDDDFDLDDLKSNVRGQFDVKGLIKCFLHGYVGNAALGLPDRRYKSILNGQTLNIHPSSMLFGQKLEAIMYLEFVYTTKPYARMVSPIQAEWLHEIAPHLLG